MNNIIKRVWVRNRMVNIDYLGGSAFYAEDGGHTFQISGAESDGSAVALSGTVAGVFLRPDNTDVAITGSCTGGVVSVTLPANCYDVQGRFGLTIFLTSDDQKTAIYAAVGNVARTSSGAVAPQTTADVVDLINRISAAVATIPQNWPGLMADIAPTYSASAVYPAGAYVYYNGDLYRCTTAITTAETWTPAHWTTANLGTDLRDLKAALDQLCNVPITWTDGQYINTGGGRTTNENFSYSQFIDVPANVTIVVKSYMYGTASICMYTAAQAFIEGSAITNSNPPVDNSILTVIPSATSARKVRVSCVTSNKGAAFVYFCVAHAEIEKLMRNVVEQIGARATSASGLLSDFNDALPNRVYTVAENTTVANCPDANKTGVLMTFNGDTSSTNGHVQIFKNATNDIYIRIKWSNTWTDWKKFSMSDLSLESIGARQNALSDTVLPDLNNAIPNRVYTITSGSASSNLPSGIGGTLLTFSGDASYNGGQVQIFVDNRGEMYSRILWGSGSGTWTLWTNLENFGIRSYFSGIGLFTNFAVIGDSFSNGLIVNSQYTDGIQKRDYAWGSIISRRNGIPVTLYGWSGYGTYDFTNPGDGRYNTQGFGKLLTDLGGDKKELYFLCFGLNDTNNTRTFGDKTGGLDYLGTSADINTSDYTQNVNSFWGNYGKIIQAIKAQSPKSRIVMCTYCRMPTTATSEAYSAFITAIQEIAAFFEIPCLTLTDDPFFNSAFYMANMVGFHPTGPQYAGYAQAIERLLSRAMLTYYSYFKEFIGL